MGVAPFIVTDVLKVTMATILLPTISRRLRGSLSKPKRVLVYKGRGVGPLSFRENPRHFKANVSPGLLSVSVDRDQMISGEAFEDAVLFAMPGGRDVPMMKIYGVLPTQTCAALLKKAEPI